MSKPSAELEAAARIDPRTVMGRRRRLQFGSLAEIISEGSRLSELVNGGNSVREDLAGPEARVVHLANMPLGQALGHLGLTLSLAVDGIDYRFPLPMRLLGRMLKGQILKGRFVAPVEAPGPINARVLPDKSMHADEGLAIMREQFARFEAAGELHENAMFGWLNRSEWIRLSCRHAEWHLGFILER